MAVCERLTVGHALLRLVLDGGDKVIVSMASGNPVSCVISLLLCGSCYKKVYFHT